jgi:hypothetical protein
MKSGKRYNTVTVFSCAIALTLTGCASGASSGGSGPTSLPAIARDAPSIANLAGKYSGKFLVKSKPVGNASFNLTQNGTSIGGILKLALSSRTVLEPVALTLDPANNTFTGSATDPKGTTKCTYELDGSYNPKTFVLRGTSSPLTCAGKVATFRTTESCFYNSGSANDIRPEARGIIEC